MELTLSNLKLHLNIDSGDTIDDTYLQQCLDVSTLAVSNYLDIPSGATLPIINNINYSIILLASNYFTNRNIVAFANPIELPYSFKFLLSPYKNIIVV